MYDNPLLFLHFVEHRMHAFQSIRVKADDELDHLGLYLKHNAYTQYADEIGQGASEITWSGYRSRIDRYFSQKLRDPGAVRPLHQSVPRRLKQIIDLLTASKKPGRRTLSSLILDYSGATRDVISSGIDKVLVEQSRSGRLMPLSACGEVNCTIFCWQLDRFVRDKENALDFTRVAMLVADDRNRLLLELFYNDSGQLVDVEHAMLSLDNTPEDAFTWNTGIGDGGTYHPWIYASDGEFTDSVMVNVTVLSSPIHHDAMADGSSAYFAWYQNQIAWFTAFDGYMSSAIYSSWESAIVSGRAFPAVDEPVFVCRIDFVKDVTNYIVGLRNTAHNPGAGVSDFAYDKIAFGIYTHSGGNVRLVVNGLVQSTVVTTLGTGVYDLKIAVGEAGAIECAIDTALSYDALLSDFSSPRWSYTGTPALNDTTWFQVNPYSSSGHKVYDVWEFPAVLPDIAAPVISDIAVVPDTLQVGDVVLVSARVVDEGAGVGSVTAYVRDAGMNVTTYTLNDAGTNGDVAAGDSVYSRAISTASFTLGTYQVAIGAEDLASETNEAFSGYGHQFEVISITGIPNIPIITQLRQNYPNPFNPTTTIEYSLRADSRVTINVYSVSGELIRRLVDEQRKAGLYQTQWDGKDQKGQAVSSGIYLYSLKVPDYSETKKMILLR